MIFSNPAVLTQQLEFRFAHCVTALLVIQYTSHISFAVIATASGQLSIWKVLPQMNVLCVCSFVNFVAITELADPVAVPVRHPSFGATTTSNNQIVSVKPTMATKSAPGSFVTQLVPFGESKARMEGSAITCLAYEPLKQILYSGDEEVRLSA